MMIPSGVDTTSTTESSTHSGPRGDDYFTIDTDENFGRSDTSLQSASTIIDKQNEISRTFASMVTRLTRMAAQQEKIIRSIGKTTAGNDDNDSGGGSSSCKSLTRQQRSQVERCAAVVGAMAEKQAKYADSLKYIIDDMAEKLKQKEEEQTVLKKKVVDLKEALSNRGSANNGDSEGKRISCNGGIAKTEKRNHHTHNHQVEHDRPPISEVTIRNTIIDISHLSDQNKGSGSIAMLKGENVQLLL